jgi:hypothetical protein
MRFLLFAVALAGCTQDFDAFLGDAAGGSDATTDSGDASADAAKDAAQDAGGKSDAALSFQCGTQTVASCAQCSGMPEPCVYCGSGSTLAGTCVAQGTSCTNGAPSGFQSCQCQNATTCPESYQVCRNGFCRTCGDSVNNTGQTCKGGGTCNPVDGGCN